MRPVKRTSGAKSRLLCNQLSANGLNAQVALWSPPAGTRFQAQCQQSGRMGATQ